MTFYIKQNDTRPIITANLVDGNGAAVNLDGASVAFKMRKVGATAATVDSSATITDATTGKVTYTWIASNTSTVGSYEGEFEVTYAGGGIQTFPNSRYIEIEIVDDIA
jgi:hypothetical protein